MIRVDRQQQLSEKRLQALRRLLRGDGKSTEEINRLFFGDPDAIQAAWDHYQALTKAERSRLFAAADHLKRQKVTTPTMPMPVVPALTSPVMVDEVVRPVRGRGKGRVSAGESFTVVLPTDLLERCRQYAYQEQRSVASVMRLALLRFLDERT